MLTKEELKANYKKFNDDKLLNLWASPQRLSTVAQEALRDEIAERGLDTSGISRDNRPSKNEGEIKVPFSDTDYSEPPENTYPGALKIYLTNQKMISNRMMFFIPMGIILIIAGVLLAQMVLFLVGLALFFLSYFLKATIGAQPQLVIYKDRLLCYRDSGRSRRRYSEVGKLMNNNTMDTIPAENIISVEQEGPFSTSPLALRLKGKSKPYLLLLIADKEETADIKRMIESTYQLASA